MPFNPNLPYEEIIGGYPAVFKQEGVLYERDGSPCNLDSENNKEFVLYGKINGITGGITSTAGGFIFGATGVVPATQDYAGCMAAILAALQMTTSRIVQFNDALYDLGGNYLPIISGLRYIGVPPRMAYTNGDWGDRNVRPLGGSRFVTTNDYAFWDGAVDQGAITPTVANQTCTVTAGSSVISVPNSSLFPVGTRIYTPEDGLGFYQGVSYFVLSSDSNQITIGMADKTAVVAAQSGSITLSAGKPNDCTSNVEMRNLVGVGVKTFIKCGAKNTIGFFYSTIDGIWATGGATKRVLFDHANFSQSTFRNIFTYDGDGQYHGCDYPLSVFIPGNSTFDHCFNANNGTGSSSLTQRGIRFQCEDGSNLNELHCDTVQNNNSLVTTQTQTATTTAASNDITVTDGTKFPVGIPVWFSAVGSNTNLYAGNIYFVTYQSGNTIRISTNKGGITLVAPDWSGATTINTKGFPGLEIVAVGTGYITSSQVTGIDVEADATTHILAQQCGSLLLDILQCAADQAQCGITARTVNGIVNNIFEKTTSDIDQNCRLQWYGNRTGTTPASRSYGGMGLWYDKTADMAALSLHFDSAISGGIPVTKPFMYGKKPSPFPWVQIQFPIGLVQNTQDTSRTFNSSSPVGHIVFNGAAGQTFTLPTITDAATKTSMVGYSFEFTNASGNALGITTSSSQTFNNIAAKTSFNLAANTHCKVIASKTSGGTLFWAVMLSAVLP